MARSKANRARCNARKYGKTREQIKIPLFDILYIVFLIVSFPFAVCLDLVKRG